ncbi:MAG: hypothetical protein ACE14V_10975 [bacterium]
MLKYLKTKSVPKKKSKKRQKYLLYIILGIFWVLIIPILGYLIQIAPVSNNTLLFLLFDNGLVTTFIFPVFGMIVLFAGPVGAVIFIVSLFQKLQRRLLRTVGIILIANFLCCYGAGKLATQVRHEKLAAATVKVQPIIAALQTYHAENKKYPNSLLDLIPKYLNAMPTSDLLGYPVIDYDKTEYVPGMMNVPDRDESKNTWKRFYTGGYELRILPPSNSSNFDRFIYWPQKVYPKYMYNGAAEPVSDWMFIRE